MLLFEAFNYLVNVYVMHTNLFAHLDVKKSSSKEGAEQRATNDDSVPSLHS